MWREHKCSMIVLPSKYLPLSYVLPTSLFNNQVGLYNNIHSSHFSGRRSGSLSDKTATTSSDKHVGISNHAYLQRSQHAPSVSIRPHAAPLPGSFQLIKQPPSRGLQCRPLSAIPSVPKPYPSTTNTMLTPIISVRLLRPK